MTWVKMYLPFFDFNTIRVKFSLKQEYVVYIYNKGVRGIKTTEKLNWNKKIHSSVATYTQLIHSHTLRSVWLHSTVEQQQQKNIYMLNRTNENKNTKT